MMLVVATILSPHEGPSDMAQVDQETLQLFAKRSDRTVMWMACWFAMGGAVMDMAGHFLPWLVQAYIPMGLWWLWLPFCFMTIPPLHYLCRYVTRLEDRVQQLEERLNLRDAA